MSVVIATNLVSLRLQTQLKRSVSELSSVYERLGSGLRINAASDDPAGLALADKLRNESKLLSVALRNANDGISYTASADAGLSEVTSLLQRMSELANQSVNSLYTTLQRSALQSEFSALGSEIVRVADSTSFNGLKTINGSSDQTIQVGFDASSNSQIIIGSVSASLSDLGLGAGSTLTYSLTGTSVNDAIEASQSALTALTSAIDLVALQRGIIGAAEGRLRSAVNTITVMRENRMAAESQVRDVDVAENVALLTKLQVLQQAQTALFAQSNLDFKQALKLLAID